MKIRKFVIIILMVLLVACASAFMGCAGLTIKNEPVTSEGSSSSSSSEDNSNNGSSDSSSNGGNEEEKNEITITFDAMGGSSVNSQTIRANSKVTKPENPSKEGFTFKYWAVKNDENYLVYNFGFIPEESFTLYAIWEKNVIKYKVTFIADGATVIEDSYVDGKVGNLPTAPLKKSTEQFDFTFIGWYFEKDGTEQKAENNFEVTNDTVVTAKYESILRKYSVTFYDENNQIILNETLAYGSEITCPTAPERESDQQYDYEFVGWNGYSADMTVKENVSFVASFKKTLRTYNVVYKCEDKVIGKTVLSFGDKITLPENVEVTNGYEIKGWKCKDVAIDGSFTVSGETEIVAEVVPIIYYVIYGEGLNKQPFTVESEDFNLAIPEKEDYEFLGWLDEDKTLVTKIVKGTVGDVVLTANWKDVSINIKTALVGGNVTYGTPVTLNYEVEYANGTATIEYLWYFKASGSETEMLLQNATSSQLILTQVSESGLYYVRAVVIKGGNKGQTTVKSDAVEVVISKAAQVITAQDVTVEYDGNPHFINKDSISALECGAENITLGNNGGRVDAGTVTVKITVKETANYLKGTAEVKLTIEPKKVAVFADPVTFNGKTLWDAVNLSYTDIYGNVCFNATLVKDGDLIDAGEYPLTATILDANYVAEGITTVVVNKGVYDGEIPTIEELIGNYTMTLSSIALPERFSWKNSSDIITKNGSYNAIYTPEDNHNYKDVEIALNIKVKAKISFVLCGGEENYTKATVDAQALADKTEFMFVNDTITLPLIENNGEQLIWFDRDDGIGQYYRGNTTQTNSQEYSKTFYGMWYYQTTAANDFDLKNGALKTYKTSGHQRIIMPLDASELYVSTAMFSTGLGAFAVNLTTANSEITHLIITENYKNSPQAMEYYTFKFTNLKNVIIAGDLSIDEHSFAYYKPLALMSNDVENMTLLSGNAVLRGSQTLKCTIFTKAEYVEHYKTADKWSAFADNIRAF